MGSRAVVVLLLIVGALAAVLLWTDRKPPADVAAEVAVLDGRSLRESKRIWWQFAGLAPVEIERAAGRFRLTEPVRDDASDAYMRQICLAWDSAQMRATPLQDDAAGREQAGLEPPELRFVVEFPDGLRLEIDVGAPGPLGSTRFLRRNGRIWEGGAGLIESVQVGVDDLRERRVFAHTPEVASEVRVEQAAATGKREVLHLVHGDGEWQLRQPIEGRADGSAAMRFLTAVLSLRADDFPPGVVRWPEGEPAIVVTVRGLAGEETVRLWLERGQIFGQIPRRSVAFVSSNNQYNAIFANAVEQLRARILVPLGNVYSELGDIVVDPGQGRGERLRLVREGDSGAWRLEEPVALPGAPTPCNEAVQAINNLHAVEFVDGPDGGRPAAADPRYGLGPGRLQVTVRAQNASEGIELWFGDAVRKNDLELVHACRADDPRTVVLVARTPVDHLRRPWTDYCSLEVVQTNAVVEQLDLVRRTGERRTFRRDGEHWVLDGAEGNRDDVGSLAHDVLRDLHGRRAVDVRGFDTADWTLEMQRDSLDTLVRLRVWERAADAPLVVQNVTNGIGPVGFELSPLNDKQLRDLWR